MIKDLLFVSIAFPPKSDPECLQTGKYFRAISKKVKDIDVVTSKNPTLFMPVDPELELLEGTYRQIVEVKLIENRYTNFLLRKISPSILEKPDSKFSFHWQYKKVVRSLKSNPEIIYSRSFPMSSAFMAYKLHCHFKCPWVLHLSDPWSWSPLHHYSDKIKEYVEKWEREFIKTAQIITLTSKKTLQYYKSLYPEFGSKFEFMPNVWDVNDLREGKELDFDHKLRIVYTGGLVGDRNPEFLFQCIRVWNRDNPSVMNTVEFCFAGAMDRRTEGLFKKYDLPNVKHLGMLSFRKAVDLQSSAHMLFLIDNPIKDPKKAVFFPSKLLDYFVARRRIFAVTTRDSATAHALNDIGEDYVEIGDREKVISIIDRACSEFRNRNQDYFIRTEPPKIYEAQYNVERLLDIFERAKATKQ